MVDALAGYTKLMLLIEENDIDGVTELLAKGIDLNVQNKSGQTALAIASKNGALGIVGKLLAQGAELNIKNKFGQTALFTACSQNFEEIVKLLIEYNADVNIKDSRGWTPLMIACYHGHSNIVKILLHHGADIIAEDSFGKTAISRTKSPEIYQMLTYYAHKELEKYQVNDPALADWSQGSLQAQNDMRAYSQTPSAQSHKGQFRSTKESVSSQSELLGTQRSPTAASVGDKQKGSRLSHDQASSKTSGKNQNAESSVPKQKLSTKETDQSVRLSKRDSPLQVQSPTQTEGEHKAGRYRYKSPETFENSPSKRINTQPQSKTSFRPQSPPLQQNASRVAKPHSSKPSTSDLNSRHPRSNNSTAEITQEPKQSSSNSFHKKSHPVLKTHAPKATSSHQPLQPAFSSEKTVPISQLKKMLSHYIGDYSGLVQTYIQQKLSYALGFEFRRCFASAKQELMTNMLENTVNLHRELLDSFAVAAEQTSSVTLSNQLAKLNDDMSTVFQDFENRLLDTAQDQYSLQALHQNSQELDALLVSDVDGRYTQKEEESRDESERDIFKFLKLEMNLQVGNVYNSVNEVLGNEFQQSDSQFKLLIQEIVSSLLGQMTSVLKSSFAQETIQEQEEEYEEQSNRKQPNSSSENVQEEETEAEVARQQQEHQHHYRYQEVQHVGYVFTDQNPLQPLDLNKENYRELDNNLPHAKNSKETNQKADSAVKTQQDTASSQTDIELFKENCFVKTEVIEIAIPSSSKKKLSQLTQITPLREETRAISFSKDEKENLELKEDNVIKNIEHISRTLDKVLSKKKFSGNKRTEIDPKKLNRYYNQYLSPELTPNNSKLSFRDLERNALIKSDEKQQQQQSIPQTQERFIITDQSELKQDNISPKFSIICTGQKEFSELVNGLTPFEIERTEDSLMNQLDSLEISKENAENSVELIGGEKSIENQHIYIQEVQSITEPIVNLEDSEKPQELTVRGIQQKTEEKLAYFTRIVSQEEENSNRDLQKTLPEEIDVSMNLARSFIVGK